MKKILLTLFTIILSGCSSLPPLPPNEPYREPIAPAENFSSLIIYRRPAFAGSGTTNRYHLENKLIARLENGEFTQILLKPGKHEIKLVNPFGETVEKIEIPMESGKTYYVKRYYDFADPDDPDSFSPIQAFPMRFKSNLSLIDKDSAMKELPNYRYRKPEINSIN